MNIYIDLEGTVIDIWTDPVLINCDRVRQWISDHHYLHGVRQVGIFSFAVWNQRDQDQFWNQLAPPLQEALDIKISQCPSIEEMMQADFGLTNVHWDGIHDFVSVRGKKDAFRSWCVLNHPGQHSLLLDDTVPNAIWQDLDSELLVELVNINSLTLDH